MEDNQKFNIVDHEDSQASAIVSFPQGQTFKIGVLLDKINSFFRESILSKLSDRLNQVGLGTVPSFNAGYWNSSGIEAEILEPKSDGWKKGKVRMRVVLEFCPDEPENKSDNNLNNSSLDEIRKTIS